MAQPIMQTLRTFSADTGSQRPGDLGSSPYHHMKTPVKSHGAERSVNVLVHRINKVARKAAWTGAGLMYPPRVSDVYDCRVTRESSDANDFVRRDIVKRIHGPALIEPDWGYVIGGRRHLIEDSMRTNWYSRQPPWHLALPSPAKYLLPRPRPTSPSTLPAVASLRHSYEWNYFHFYFDVLGKLSLLADAGLPESTPLALGRYADELAFVRECLSLGTLKYRNWLIPSTEDIRADSVYYCRVGRSFKDRIDGVLDGMEIDSISPTADRKTFLTRPPAATRRITNSSAVTDLLHSFGFDIVDTTGMPVAEQISLFRSTRHLVANHGAGLTNIVHRRGNELDVLELYGNHNSFDFRTICDQFGYRWQGLAGTSEPGWPGHADFEVNLSELETSLSVMLNSDGGQAG